MLVALKKLRNTSFASLLGDRRDLVGLIIRPDWLKTAAELYGAEKSCKAILPMFVLYENEWKKLKNCLNVHL